MDARQKKDYPKRLLMYGRLTTTAHDTNGSNGHFQPLPDPGSAEEAICFKKIQEQFKDQFEKAFPDKLAPKTVVIIPSHWTRKFCRK
jgi:hypothetical protein